MSTKDIFEKQSYVSVDMAQLLEVEPYGLAPGLNDTRPVLIFKSLDQRLTLAIPLSPLDAGISVAQSHGVGTSSSPHRLALKILQQLQYEVEFCLIKKVKGHHVFVEVHLRPENSEVCTMKLDSRADEAISFCLQAGAKFFVESDAIAELRELEARPQMHDQPPVKSFGFESKKVPYLM
ncbi:MAG: bifunctional nuclease family protein [Bdellovibrionales bacterium]|nr:bifunctional nuclease family protein [Bdellovibrionales bacterium]